MGAKSSATSCRPRKPTTPSPHSTSGTGTETVPLAEANGRVLAERIGAALDVPGFDRSALDGYALRARETFGADEADPSIFEVVGTVEAGERPNVELGLGEAVEIATGVVMPSDTDAMVCPSNGRRNGTERSSSARR